MCALGSLAQGVFNGLTRSQDLQWSATRLILNHIDPWKVTLDGDPQGLIIMGQYPPYLHWLYILMAPIGMVSFPVARVLWTLANLVFTAMVLSLVSRQFGLDRTRIAALTLAFVASTPFRNGLGNGQQGMLELLLVAVAFAMTAEPARGFFLGLSFAKFSFAPPYFFDLLVSRRVLALVCAGVPAIVGLVWAHAMVGGDWLVLLLEPLKTAKVSGPGNADLMSLATFVLPESLLGGIPVAVCRYLLPFALSFALAWQVRFQSGPDGAERNRFAAAVYALAAVALFRHLGYDQVFLIFPAAYVLRHWSLSQARWAAAILGWFWFVLRVSDALLPKISLAMVVPNVVLFIALHVLLTQIERARRAAVPDEAHS